MTDEKCEGEKIMEQLKNGDESQKIVHLSFVLENVLKTEDIYLRSTTWERIAEEIYRANEQEKIEGEGPPVGCMTIKQIEHRDDEMEE